MFGNFFVINDPVVFDRVASALKTQFIADALASGAASGL